MANEVKLEKYDVLQISYIDGTPGPWLDFVGLKTTEEMKMAEDAVTKRTQLFQNTFLRDYHRDQYKLRIIRGGRQEVILSEIPKGWDKVDTSVE